jgi:hypothetical protein
MSYTHSSCSIPDADETIANGAFEEYAGSHRIKTASNTTMEVTISEGSKVYRFCDQDFLERLSALFDFFHEDKREWMSKNQIWLSYSFSIVCGILIIVMSYYTYKSIILPYIEQAIGKEYVSALSRQLLAAKCGRSSSFRSCAHHFLFCTCVSFDIILYKTEDRRN